MIVVRGCAFRPDLHYHVAHNVWVQALGNGEVLLGATSFGVALAGEFVSFRPKPAGTRVLVNGSVGLIELWKTMVSVRSPLAGELVEGNDAAAKNPALINKDPYGTGWLVRLRVADWAAAAQGLVTGAAIGAAFEEAMRLENFDGPEKQ